MGGPLCGSVVVQGGVIPSDDLRWEQGGPGNPVQWWSKRHLGEVEGGGGSCHDVGVELHHRVRCCVGVVMQCPSDRESCKKDPGVLAPVIIKFFGIPSYTFQRGDAFQQALKHRLFRHVAVPLAVGRRVLPEEKVIPKTDFDLPIATCCLTLRSWQGSTTLSRSNRPPRAAAPYHGRWRPRETLLIATFDERIAPSHML